ncbi:MAG: Membrane-bound lytic murein transglycosylase C [Nitrospira sp.]|jgi:membrane-bound lytic murein transglycosylase C|nr:MAG: Membrane-bound lytic murein transglycosylase C [Nitrospira sp.]
MHSRHWPSLLLGLTIPALLSGCETTDKMLGAAERAVGSSTGRTVLDIVGGKDPADIARQRVENYGRDPQALLRDLRAVQRDFQALMAALTGEVGKKWGTKEVKVPEQKKYVKYTQNYRSRAIVDFDAGNILIETLDEKDPRASLKNAVVTTLLTPDDPRSVDLFSDKEITLIGDKEPYLFGLVVDRAGKPVRTPAEAEQFAESLLAKGPTTRQVEREDGQKTAHLVNIPMVTNFSHKQAEKYRGVVAQFAERYQISPSLVFAIIRTESNFNPFAVSSAPAYGLMQLVPTSGGRDAYRKAKGEDKAPTRDYLFDPENNIELGTAYLNVLTYSQLDDVTDLVSREYCVISAYNTGAGNVFKTFSKDQRSALQQINGMQPAALYDRLRTALPYQETRDYLAKVVGFRKQFVSLGDNGVK